MSISSEIATDATIHDIVLRIARLHEESGDGAERRSYRAAIYAALTCFEWEMPTWARELKATMEAEDGIPPGLKKQLAADGG